MLSRIEHGQVSASVETLERIAHGLSVPVARLLGDPSAQRQFSLVRSGEGMVIAHEGPATGYHYQLLGHGLSGPLSVEPYLVTLSPNAGPYTEFQRPGLLLVRWLSGCVTYRYGTKVMSLQSGDTIVFGAEVQHGIESIQQHPVAYLSISFTLRS